MFARTGSAIFLVWATLLLASGCAHEYNFKPIPVRDASAYGNSRTVLGSATVGAEAYYESGRLKEVFGFNLKDAGVVPVQVAIDNFGPLPLSLVYGARILDQDGRWWELLPDSVVLDRVNEYTSGGLEGGQVVKQGFLFGLAGALVGAAVGVVTNTNVGEAIGKGAAVGGALGMSKEILTMDEDPGKPREVGRDFSSRNMAERIIPAQVSDHGLLYFPAEMARPQTLRLYFQRAEVKGSRNSATALSADVETVELPL